MRPTPSPWPPCPHQRPARESPPASETRMPASTGLRTPAAVSGVENDRSGSRARFPRSLSVATISSATSTFQLEASWGWTPAVAEQSSSRASATACAVVSAESAMITKWPTPDSRARATTKSRSESNCGSPKWQWVSINTGQPGLEEDSGGGGGRFGLGADRPRSANVLTRPPLLDLEQEG